MSFLWIYPVSDLADAGGPGAGHDLEPDGADTADRNGIDPVMDHL